MGGFYLPPLNLTAMISGLADLAALSGLREERQHRIRRRIETAHKRSKYTGAALREMRARNGVGRPPRKP
jgi:hypothetical protein